MANLKKLTLLHSNDLHGDFFAETIDDELVGGVSMLSGYIRKVRREEDNVIYAIAGDMFKGHVIDQRYRGLSTIQIMNHLGPDIVALGNHEFDYGVAHLLFLERCASFPMINANLYLGLNHERLFSPCRIIEIDGMRILFISVITEITLSKCQCDGLIGSLVTIEDAVKEVAEICRLYRTTDIDFTVLLTHIGFEEDKKLARQLDPSWGVDVIIGGHSHTLLSEPCVINGIPIVQAGIGTNAIGRFDIFIDTDDNCIDSFEWKTVDITPRNCPRDLEIEKIINDINEKTLAESRVNITTFARELTHFKGARETQLGDLFSDIFRDEFKLDIFLLGSGSICSPSLGPSVSRGEFQECFPFNDAIYMIHITGAQLKSMILYMLRDDAFSDKHCEFYQVSDGLYIEYDQPTHSFVRFDFRGKPVDDGDEFNVGLQEFHYRNMKLSFNFTTDQIPGFCERRLADGCAQMLEGILRNKRNLNSKGEGRLVLHRL